MLQKIIKSWAQTEKVLHSEEELLNWVKNLNETTVVKIKQNKLSESAYWSYNDKTGCIQNSTNSFFRISGIKVEQNNEIVTEQPIMIQEEIGYLGIICKEIKGVLYFLMQAKIEPGNINKVQISPTIQATKSNFTRKHGGGKPPYLDYFIEAKKHTVIVDQIQSEQSSRFFKKRNRNIIIVVEDEIPVLKSHKWMTLGQIKRLMRYDNLVNMDTRTVLSCIPLSLYPLDIESLEDYFVDKDLYRSIANKDILSEMTSIYSFMNDYKMFSESVSHLVPVHELQGWSMSDDGIRCKSKYSFSVIYCDIEVEGREVRNWTQPLFMAEGMATFALLTCVEDGIRKFLVRAYPEIGCFDKIEIGPTMQKEVNQKVPENKLEELILKKCTDTKDVLYDAILSEEGGRFYHEQNKNLIIDVSKEEVGTLPSGYFWLSYSTLNIMNQSNNTLNIQLRNLLSLLEV